MQAFHRVPQYVSDLIVRFLALLTCLLAWMQNADASTFAYSLGYRAEYSDNISRVSEEAQRDVIYTLNGGFSYLQNTSIFKARVAANVAYYDYYYQTFDPQTNLRLDAYGELFFVPQVLSWMAADGFRKVQIDPRLPNVPTNQQNSNVFLTGPNVYLHLGPVDTVTLEARYGRAGLESFIVENETFNIDSERDFFATRWLHRLSTWSSLGLNYEFMDVDYEDSGPTGQNADYQRHNYFLRTRIRSARNDYTADVGKSRIEFEQGLPISNSFIRLAASRQINSLSSLSLQYAREYSDTGAQLLPAEATSQPTPGGVLAPIGTDIVASELFYSEQTNVSYAWRGNTLPWSARLFSRNVDYLVTGEDREEVGSLIDVRYVYSNSLSFLAFSRYTITSYTNPTREDTDVITSVGLLYRLGRSLTAGLDLRRYVRIVNPTNPDQEYTDNRVGATITYSYQPVIR